VSALETCPGCGEKRLLFEPEHRCIDCRDRGGVQLAFDLNTAPLIRAKPPVSRRVPPGPARLLRKLVTDGLDVGAIEAAAALVAALDEGTA
jgi:hypothetical protein